MFKKLLVLFAVFQFSIFSFSQEKQEFNFSNSSMITSYVLIGAGVILITGAQFMKKESSGGYFATDIGSKDFVITAGSLSTSGGVLVGLIDSIAQLVQMRRNNPLGYNKLLNEYDDIVVESEVVSLDRDLSFHASISRELMTGLKQSNNINDKAYAQKLSLVIKSLDNLAYDLSQSTLDIEDINNQISEISAGVISKEHAKRLVALRISSLI